MELGLSSQEDCHLKKILFNLKTHRTDGLILQIHHSYVDSGGESKRLRFICASFNGGGNHLAVSDHKGHIFIINLGMEWYWQLPQVGLPTIISFPVVRNQELLVGLDNASILLIHIETGSVTGVLQGHSVPATEVSYSDDGYYYLTSCSAEAIVWESTTFTQIHRLSLKLEVSLKKVLFMPVTNHILACFQDDTMHVWKFKSFECIKQIVPDTWKTHHLRAIAITKNGRAMIIGGHCPNLVVFCLDTWAIKNVVEFPESITGVKQLEFLSQVFDGGANKILVALTMSQELVFFDVESLLFLRWIHQSGGLTGKFSLSSNGKYIASVLTTGEVNVHTTEKVLSDNVSARDADEWCADSQNLRRINHSSNSRTQKSYESLSSIQQEIKNVLGEKKLLPILKQFGEYPQSYRTLIWKTLLKIPENKESFVSLSLKKCHPSYSKLESKYPLANKSLCSSLKRLLSNLSHWCPLFGEVEFLPEFVFPFVKLFHASPLVCFEVVATIIVNYCQNWFEFYPFPPINMLSVLESILGYHDPNLLQFYVANNITSSVTVCPLFHTAFSEVLSKTEWLKLWDHVLSNEPSFLFMAVIAYNVVCQSAIRNLRGVAEIEKFFHTQNPVDLKMVLSKAYHYLKATPEDIHTRQFFSAFRPLGTGGTYASFLAYPKLIVDSSVEKLQCIREEEDRVLDEQFKALNLKKTLEKSLKQDGGLENKEKIYEELEERIRKTVEEEEERLLTERRKLENMRQELKLKELQVLETTRDKALNERIRRKEKELERLLSDISKRRLREKGEADVMEKEIRNYYSDLLLRKCQLELELGVADAEEDAEGKPEWKREKLQADWSDHSHGKSLDLCGKVAAIKDLISNVEKELAGEIVKRGSGKPTKEELAFIDELKRGIRSLEDEIENLVKENLNKLRREKEQRIADHQKNLELSRKKKDPNAGTTKTRRFISKSVSPGSPSSVRKITTIRTRVPKPKAGHSVVEKRQVQSLNENLENLLSSATTASKKPDHLRSKFTCVGEPQRSSFDSPDHDDDPEGRDKPVDLKSSKSGKIPRTSRGDCPVEGKPSKVQKSFKNKKKGKVSKFTIKKDDRFSGSEEEIFKSALKARNEIVEEAKRRQLLK